ncbi:hypothetical protein Phum_PHUM331800 [Pediculus humanus corporis]|uniref:Uncharacterized protein n=1 Tax=Pediculus humanus subsp. corporis TaxID=121224 RepID=E0VN87_PEDHC|nr:uncharacterized protein Phum_PHUM331800 [Pediculus humanus corporis]EEB14843.1 hypothetical protein Phum_PHUM331800 [Pediculus humanus corporis]
MKIPKRYLRYWVEAIGRHNFVGNKTIEQFPAYFQSIHNNIHSCEKQPNKQATNTSINNRIPQAGEVHG